ncbi:hypothetical protein LT330_001765 [Penicillium expansum]|nr:hypothetical protein LT330_001765 [Penicillium expansum]
MASESPKDLPVRPAAEAQANNASEAASAPPNDAKAKSKQAPSPDTLPEFMIERNNLFEELWQQYLEETKNRPHPEINVTLDIGDGNPSSVPAKAFETTPGSFLRDVPKDLSANIVIAKVDGELWDLNRPLEKDCSVLLVPFSNPEAREVFWHSSAHTLGEACECHYKALLSHGPPTPQGFFYDMAMPNGEVVREADWKVLDTKAARIFKEKQSFDRLDVSKENLKKMFAYSKYKLHYIDKLVTGESSTVYRCGTLVDLCRGPHIQNTGKIKTFKIMQNSSAYFLGDQSNDSLQRIRGVAFPDKKQMAEHLKFLEEAEKRNHLRIGKEQELFFFDEVSPGCPFLLPNGTKILNQIQSLLRSEYRKRGYQEVQTPNMYDVSIWKTSGHWAHYKDDMFKLDVEKREWALKPMNCPGHFALFAHRERSYRELPMRIADFGVLHRNEASGALSGLTRVRKFSQDDAHLIIAAEQIMSEVEGLFDFLQSIYGLFGFTFKLKLSTRPEKYMGSLETWDHAEDQLKQALTKFKGNDWTINEGDGAFYGPKIDITIADALKREFQCATIQLDYQAPLNFKLEYQTDGSREKNTEVDAKEGESKSDDLPPGRARPVVIHRAIIGSFERFLGILIEHFGGKWPFWISPRQILIVPVMPALNDYAEELQRILHGDKLNVDVDVSGNTLQKKIRTGQLAQYNFIFVVGAQEKESRTVNIRNRDDPATQNKGIMVPLEEARLKLRALRKERRLENTLHVNQVHSRHFPCPRAGDLNCRKKFHSEDAANDHATSAHDEREPCPCPRADDLECKETFYSKTSAQRHANEAHKGIKWACPRAEELDCQLMFDSKMKARQHSQRDHERVKWPCPHASELDCDKMFISERNANIHAEGVHNPSRWPCPHADDLNCPNTYAFQKDAIKHGKYAHETEIVEWPCPLAEEEGCDVTFRSKRIAQMHAKVLSSLPGDNVGTEDEVGDSEDEKDGDGEDSESESEDDELDESVGAEPTAEAAAAWLGSPPKKQNILREAAQSDGLIHLGLKCPGPERVVDGLVIGTQVCPHNAIISFETGTFYKDRLRDRVGLKARCAPCNGRFMFNEFLRVRFLEAGADQKTCHYKSCVGVLWEGSKLCQKHFLAWKPGLPGEDDMKKMKSLFDQATSVQWYPETKVMADIIRRIESDNKAKIPASEVVNIDLEFSFYSQAVLQVGLADLAGNKVLDCLTQYGEGIIAPSSSRLSAPATWRQQNHAAKVKRYYTQDGKLNAKRVVEKLREANISQDTKFMSWASWGFDLSFLRDWLDDEGFSDVLPGDENLCLLYHEFRVNIKRVLGTNCYGGKSFPLSLPTFYPVIFGTNDPLSGRNHHAFVDSQQLSRLTNLFVDLCKPPNKRGGIETLRLRKRQRGLEEYLPNLSIHNKRAKGS